MGIALFFLPIFKICAQDKYDGIDIWFFSKIKWEVSKKISLSLELQHRRDQWVTDIEQNLIRPSGGFKVNDNVILSLGYSFIKTYPYGKFPILAPISESNIWEQFFLKIPIGSINFFSRIRLEQRWIGFPKEADKTNEDSKINYLNRFRLRIGLKAFPTSKFYGIMFNEFWINFPNHGHLLAADRNWFAIGGGYNNKTIFSFEIRYLNQFIQHGSIPVERHHTFQVLFFINL